MADLAARTLAWLLATLVDPRVLVSAALLWLGWLAERRRAMAAFQRWLSERAAHRQRTCDARNRGDAVARWRVEHPRGDALIFLAPNPRSPSARHGLALWGPVGWNDVVGG